MCMSQSYAKSAGTAWCLNNGPLHIVRGFNSNPLTSSKLVVKFLTTPPSPTHLNEKMKNKEKLKKKERKTDTPQI